MLAIWPGSTSARLRPVGLAALHRASQSGAGEVVRLLLAAQAHPDGPGDLAVRLYVFDYLSISLSHSLIFSCSCHFLSILRSRICKDLSAADGCRMWSFQHRAPFAGC